MKQPCPEVVTYQHVGGNTSIGWLSRYVVTKKTKTGVAHEFLPMIFCGHSEMQVHRDALDWWDEQQRKLESKQENIAKAQAARLLRSVA